MKRILLTILLTTGILIPVFALPSSVYAVDVFQACSEVGGASGTQACKAAGEGTTSNPIVEILKVVLEILSIVVGIASVVGVILGGIKFITSNGEPSSVKSARDTVLYSLIGAVVVIFAQAIVAFVLDTIQ
jgi:hypothetical protein